MASRTIWTIMRCRRRSRHHPLSGCGRPYLQNFRSAGGGSYEEPLSDTYGAEYYYETDPETGSYSLRFVFVFGSGEEYRFYFLRDGRCILYIGSDGEIQDYLPLVESLEDVTETWRFCSLAKMEIAWAYGG